MDWTVIAIVAIFVWGVVQLSLAYIYGWVFSVSYHFVEKAYHEANDWWLFLAFAWVIFWICSPLAALLWIARA